MFTILLIKSSKVNQVVHEKFVMQIINKIEKKNVWLIIIIDNSKMITDKIYYHWKLNFYNCSHSESFLHNFLDMQVKSLIINQVIVKSLRLKIRVLNINFQKLLFIAIEIKIFYEKILYIISEYFAIAF